MSKNILIIMGSPRKNGSTAALCRQFAKGAEEAGHKVKTVNVIEDKINPCLGCNYCGSHNGQCCQPDAMRTIYQDFDKCDVIVLASPVYYYSITAQLKAFVDRLYAPGMGNGFKYDPKESVLIMTCGEAEKDVFDQPKMYYDNIRKRLFPWTHRGEILETGFSASPDVNEHKEALEEAYQLGKSI